MVWLQGACFPSCKYHELNLFPAPGVYKYNEVNSVQFGEKCQLHSTLKQFAHIQTYPQLSYGHCNHYHCISFNLWGLTKVLSHIKMEQIGCLLNTHWKHKADSRCLQVVVGSCLFVFYIVITHTSDHWSLVYTGNLSSQLLIRHNVQLPSCFYHDIVHCVQAAGAVILPICCGETEV